ncbi:MAG TPA: acyl-CoA dehydrogenase family protein [Acidimicrobiales bacterium]|nr:acyl-CoA dehydrogenase family protein [Acidimicrobiales bacterium]
MDADERALFTRGVTRAVAARSGEALDRALDELGWLDALQTDPAVATSVFFEQQGAANASSSSLGRIMAAALSPGLRAGEEPVALVLPALGDDRAPGTLGAGRCSVRGLAIGWPRGDTAVVTTEDGGRHRSAPVARAALTLRAIQGIDPALGVLEVGGDVAAGDCTEAEDVHWAGALAVGRRALGHELVGAGRAMLELARQHAVDRVQFGRPIASFQAVRHRLAESLVALDASAALLAASWERADDGELASMAKAMAGRSARVTARHCQQVLAGIGFTIEHPFHRHVRRIMVLDQLLGSGTVLTRTLGTEILGRASLPATLPL